MRADLEGGIADRSEAHPLQPHDRMADGFTHQAHLAGPAFMQHNRHERLIAAGAEARGHHARVRRRGAPAINCHSAPQLSQRVLARLAAHAGVVLAFDLVARVEQPLGERPVVGEQQQALGVVVEAAHRVDVLADVGQQVEDGRTALRVPARRDVAARLVQQDVAVADRDADALTVDADLVPVGIRP
jgi:hypothetical protein